MKKHFPLTYSTQTISRYLKPVCFAFDKKKTVKDMIDENKAI
jgi:hypothetical protein